MPDARVINLFGSTPAMPPPDAEQPLPGFASIEEFKEVVIPELEYQLAMFEAFDDEQWREWMRDFRSRVMNWPV